MSAALKQSEPCGVNERASRRANGPVLYPSNKGTLLPFVRPSLENCRLSIAEASLVTRLMVRDKSAGQWPFMDRRSIVHKV